MTVDFSHGYQPPGVYPSEDVSPLVSVTGLPPTVVALVGPSAGSETHSEQIVLGQGVFLDEQGIDLTSIVVTRVDTGATLVPTTDYAVHVNGDPTTGDQDYTVDLTRVATGALGDTDTPVFVSYRYTSPDYFTAKTFENYEDVKARYGEPLNTTPQQPTDVGYRAVTSPVSFAAGLAFRAGAGAVTILPTTPPPAAAGTAAAVSAANRAALAAAYDKIETDPDITLVVPLTDGILDADVPGALADLRSFLVASEADGTPRFGLLGFDPGVGTSPDTLVGENPYKRVSLAYAGPQGMSYYNGAVNSYLAVGHQYAAAVAAGLLSVNPVQYGLTRQVLPGFAGIAGTPISTSLKNQYAAAGVMVIERRNNRTVLRHGVTTDPTNVNTREISVIRARDTMVTFVQNGIDTSGLIGSPIEPTTLQSVKSIVSGLLEHLTLTGTIEAYTSLQVRQASTDPSVIEVRFGYAPSYPLNYITVVFSIDLTSGTVNDTTAPATTTTP